jgi:hypothetical protein
MAQWLNESIPPMERGAMYLHYSKHIPPAPAKSIMARQNRTMDTSATSATIFFICGK